jgi:transposase
MNFTTVTTIGLDLAKNIFQIHGANAQGKQVFNKALKRDKLAQFFQLQPSCLVAMEACASAHHWARLIRSMGHEVRLIAPQHVKPYVQGNKHDAADAAAICEAQTIPGIGPISASALVAAIGDVSVFKNARQLAAWLGLVPAQHSSGGKTQMKGIGKRGDSYLRNLLVHGARSVICALQKKSKRQAAAAGLDLGVSADGARQTVDQGGGMGAPTGQQEQAWLASLLARRHANVATVALAAKNARRVWAVLKSGRSYEPGYVDARFAKAA